MKPFEKRVEEFVQYHINGDGECNTVVLSEWANRRNLGLQERFELAYFFSVTYCVESAIVIFLQKKEALENPRGWARENKEKLVFQSDRKYMKMKDSFENSLSWFSKHRDAGKFLKNIEKDGRIDLDLAVSEVEGWYMFGRFSAFLFLEMFVNLIGAEFENTTIDWKHGNTATSGLLNVFGFDDAANAFDKAGRLLLPIEKMDNMLSYVMSAISSAGGVPNVTEVETSLCAYRKFYKGSRYNGYYLDRMLEELRKMSRDYPNITKELFEIRKEKFDQRYLGEICGWSGVRSKMKKLYRETGLIT